MNILSVALPASGFSSVLSIQTLNVNDPVGFGVGTGLTSDDRFILYGTLDSAAVDATNATNLGYFSGGTNALPAGITEQAQTWPFLLVKRVSGSGAGSLFVAGNPLTAPAVVSASAPTTVGAYSAVLDLTPLNAARVRIGGSRQMTALDKFDIFLSNDSAITSSTDCYYAGQIVGGGETAISSLAVSGFSYAIVQRVAGTTSGTIIAAGVSPTAGGGGTLNLDTLVVGNTAVNGPLGGLPGTDSVDKYSNFLAVQTTPTITALLPIPSDSTLGKVVLVENDASATTSLLMYGETLNPGSVQMFIWTLSGWVGGQVVTQGGNAFNLALTIGTVDAFNVNLIRAGSTFLTDDGINTTAGRTSGASHLIGQSGTGGVSLTTATIGAISAITGTTGAATLDSGTTGNVNVGTGIAGGGKIVSVGNVNGTTSLVLQAGTTGVAISTGTTGPVSISTGTTGAASLDSGTTGPVNVGTGTNAKTVTVGNSTGTTSVVVNTGTGALSLGTGATDHSSTLGSVAGASLTTIQGGTSGVTVQPAATGAVSVTSGTTGTASFDSGTTGAVNIGTGSNAKTVTVGSTTGASALAIRAGSGGLIVVNNGVTYTWPTSAPTINGQSLVSTTAGAMTWSGAVNVNATKGSAQTITDGGGATPITGFTEVTDTAAAFDPTAGTFTVPTTGFYQICFHVEWAATAVSLGATFEAGIAVNGIVVANDKFVNEVAALGAIRTTQVSRGLQLVSGQTVSFRVQLSGAGTNVATTASDPNNGVSIAKIG